MGEQYQEVMGASASRPGSRPADHAPAGHGSASVDPSRVVDYINAASTEGMIAEYAAHYAEDGWANPETWNQFKRVMNSKIGVSRTDGMRVVLSHIPASEWNDEDRIDVGGANDEHANWSLSFTPWGEWKLMEVEDATGKALTVDQIAAHLFNEICWYGWEDESEQTRDKVLDLKESVDRGLVKLTPVFPRDSGGLPEGGDGEAGSVRSKPERPREDGASPNPNHSQDHP